MYWKILLNWQNLLDILLIAAGLFFLYRTLLRLGTWKILVGILIAFLLFVIANFLNLEGIEWIFENVSHVALLGLIIIFQPEIRKIFEKVVSLTFAKGKRKGNESAAVVAESLWTLAQQKRGAIIVIPGKEMLQDKISGGYKLNAIPSKALLLSIFDPHSAGHDGAVIMSNDILTDFAVRLPISSSSRLSDDFGTRHHAAMGMSEEKDALVLLVSEERGHVMSFYQGRMNHLENVDGIEKTIRRHTEQFGARTSKQPLNINRNTALQVLGSVAVAVLFWTTMIIGEKQVVERTISVPVVYTSPRDGLFFHGNRLNEVVVHAAGPKSDINYFVLSDPKAVVDLSKLEAGEQRVLLSRDNIRHPKEVTLMDISPPEVSINLAHLIKTHVKIIPQLIGSLPPHLQLKSIEISPSEIEILAPPLQIKQNEINISTTPIYLSSLENTSVIDSKIIAPPSLQSADKRWPDVRVKISVEKK